SGAAPGGLAAHDLCGKPAACFRHGVDARVRYISLALRAAVDPPAGVTRSNAYLTKRKGRKGRKRTRRKAKNEREWFVVHWRRGGAVPEKQRAVVRHPN